VVNDPRVTTSAADLAAQYAFGRQLVAAIDSTVVAAERIQTMQRQLRGAIARAKGTPYASRVSQAADSLERRLETVRDALVEVHSHADEITLHYPIKIYNKLLTLNAMLESADAAPTRAEEDSFRELRGQLDQQLGRLHTLESTEVAAFNKMMRDLQVPAVRAPTRR
jgi:hypothetical protein